MKNPSKYWSGAQNLQSWQSALEPWRLRRKSSAAHVGELVRVAFVGPHPTAGGVAHKPIPFS